ncbi:MAG: Dabb family protein [Candidatus Cloacimonetes bacterium]|nr:Dabb family protein [Candidatus Cloacimonadota bacterium]
MIKHIVLWKFLDITEEGTKKENLKHAESLLLAMKDKIEGIAELKAGINMQIEDGYSDLVLSITFTDETALKAYQNHPAHQEVKEFLGKVRYERRVIDYEINQ